MGERFCGTGYWSFDGFEIIPTVTEGSTSPSRTNATGEREPRKLR